jgi:hypothetical protein
MSFSIMKPSFLLFRRLAVLAAFFALCSASPAQSISWSADDATNSVSSNWSDPLNWAGGALPGAANTAIFDNDGASTASVSGGGAADNIVDQNFTLTSLLYEQTNAAEFSTIAQLWHNTVINSNATLTLSNTDISIMLDSGTLSDPPSGLTYCYSTISGPGSLVVNNTNAGSAICVQQSSSTYAGDYQQWATLDLSGLTNFDATVGRLMVGVQGIGAAPGQVNLFNDNRATGYLYLAATNNITLTQPGIVQSNGNPGAFAAAAGPALVLADTYGNFSDFQCFLYLGQENTINADTITIGRNQTYHTAHFGFNTTTYPTGPALTLGGYSSSRVSAFMVADNTAWPGNGGCCVGTGTSPNEMVQPAYDNSVDIGCAGLVDLSEGTSEMMIDTLVIAKGWDGVGINNVNFGPSGKVLGVFNMGAGTLDVNTLQLGVQSSASATTPVTGTLNVNGGSVLVHSNQVPLGLTLGGDAIATANLNITNGGSLILDNGYGIVDSGQSLSEVTLENATLTAANIGSSAAPIGSVTIGDSTLNLAVDSVTGSLVANSLTTESTTSGITINITSIGQVPGLEQIITLISSGTPIAYAGTYTGGVNGFNLGPLPNGYAGHLQVTASAVQLVLTHSLSVPDSWTGADIASVHNTNWSDVNNWSAAIEPSLSNPAYFLTSGSVVSSALSAPGGGPAAVVSANVNNIVDGNVTTIGLTYDNTNGTYQNTSIANNNTLTASSSGLGLSVGSSLQDFGNTTGHVTISGPGTLAVNSGFYVGLGDTNSGSTPQATLDMSALSTFNASVPTFLVGVGLTVPQAGGVVYLGQSNTITAMSSQADDSDSSPVALEVGDSSTLAGSISSALYLGETNVIDASAISVGRQLGSGGLFFNPAVTNSNPTASSGPWAFISGAGGGTSPVGTWTIGDGVANPGSTDPVVATGTNDFTGGYVSALVNTLTVAVNSSSDSISQASAVTGTLTFDAGGIIADTLNVSINNTNSGGDVYNYGVGTVNVDGTGTLTVNNTLTLAYAAGPPATAEVVPTATLNIDGGSVLANNIVAGANGAVSVLTMNGGSLICSNAVGSPAAPVTTLNLTNSSIEIALSSAAAPFINAGNVNAGGTNTITLLSLPSIIERYPATITILQSATAIQGAIGNIKVVIPAQFAGGAAPSGDSKAILLTLTSGPVGARGNVSWTGSDASALVSTNWTDVNNWSLSTLGLASFPGPGDTALFDNNGVAVASFASGGGVDNIVNSNLTMAALQYSQTNADEFSALDQIWHNTVINPNATLTLANTTISIMLESGTQSDPPSGFTYCYNSISGGGALVVNNTNTGSAISVEQGSATYTGDPGLYAILDMSGLNTFVATVGRLMVGVEGVGPTPGQVDLYPSQRAAGRLSLAATNVITLTQPGNSQGFLNEAAVAGPALVVSDLANFGDNPSYLNLGQNNTINADTITVGRNGSLQSAVLQFNTAVYPSGSSLTLGGYSSNRVSEFVVADSTINQNSSQYEIPDPRIVVTPQISGGFVDGDSGVVDLSAGTNNIMIDTLILGKGYDQAGGGYVVGLFNMGTGTLNVNTLLMGVLSASSANKPVTGILNVPANGTVIVNTQLALGQGFGGATSTLGAGNLTINGGTVLASSIVTDNNTNSSISVLSGGTLSLTSVSGTIGSVAAPVGSLTIDNSTLNLAIGGTGPTVVCSNLVTDVTLGTFNTINITDLPVISSTPTTLTLIQSGNPAVGTFNFVLGTKPAGYTCSLVNSFVNGNAVQLTITGVPSPTNGHGTSITGVNFQLATSSLVITGTNGLANDVFYVLTSTNLALPIASWTPIATNTFDASGNFNISLPYSEGNEQQYYSIKSQ